MKAFKFLTCLLLALFMGTTARSQTPTVYLSGTTIYHKTRVISNMAQVFNYEEPVITSLGANKQGVFALARTRAFPYTFWEHNDNSRDYYQHWYEPRWNCTYIGGGVIYNNKTVYKSYTDPDFENEDFYSSLVMKVSGNNVIVAGVHTRKYKYDKNHNYHLGFESMQIGEVNKLSVFRGTWQHQGNAGKYYSKNSGFTNDVLRKLRPMVCHITDCAYYKGKIYAVGCKEHDGDAWCLSRACRESYYNHRAQIWENGEDFMQVSSGDYSSSWANSITCIRDIKGNNRFYTCGYKWQPKQYLQDGKVKGSFSYDVKHMGLVWRDKKEVKKFYEKSFPRDYGVDCRKAQVLKQVIINYGYGYYLFDQTLYEVQFKDDGSIKSMASVLGDHNVKVLDICFPGVYRAGGCYALVEENGEDKVYLVDYGGSRKLIHNFRNTGMTNKLIAVCEP